MIQSESARGERSSRNSFSAGKWLAYFAKNRLHRPEPQWECAVEAPASCALVKSLEQFQLGDGGGPACLIARDAESFRGSSEEMRLLVDAWFAEEREHSRLLGEALKRFGGRRIESHWSFTVFCTCRRVLGVRFELQVLLLTEIVSTAYYRLMRRHAADIPLRQMCSLILRDETGHVAFHLDRIASKRKQKGWWEAQFWICGLAAGTMLWANHGNALKGLGAQTSEFYGEIVLEIARFLKRLGRRLRENASARNTILASSTGSVPAHSPVLAVR